MLSEQDRSSLLAIEQRLRDTDEGLVRSFDILARIADQRPDVVPVPRPGPPPPAPPRPHRGSPLRLLQWMLAAALVLPVVSLVVAVASRDATTLAVCAAFGALSGLVGFAAAAAVRARRR